MLFRVWCENNREYEINNYSIDSYGNILYGWTTVRPETHKVEFSTRLKDANWQEIFQGDIVEGPFHSAWSHDVIRCEVVWNEVSACFECAELAQNGYYCTHNVKFSKNVKIIGNIHENKNLLDMDEEGNYVVQNLW